MSERIDVLMAMEAAGVDAEAAAMQVEPMVRLQRVVLVTRAADLRKARSAVEALVEAVRKFQLADEAASNCPALLLSSPTESDEPIRLMAELESAKDAMFAALARIAPNELHDKAAELRGRGE